MAAPARRRRASCAWGTPTVRWARCVTSRAGPSSCTSRSRSAADGDGDNAMRARMTAMTLALLTLVGGPAAARPVTIADVIGSPESYSGKTVTVTGKVELSLPLGSESGFDLRD